jgi:hypothetical protein
MDVAQYITIEQSTHSVNYLCQFPHTAQFANGGALPFVDSMTTVTGLLIPLF